MYRKQFVDAVDVHWGDTRLCAFADTSEVQVLFVNV